MNYNRFGLPRLAFSKSRNDNFLYFLYCEANRRFDKAIKSLSSLRGVANAEAI